MLCIGVSYAMLRSKCIIRGVRLYFLIVFDVFFFTNNNDWIACVRMAGIVPKCGYRSRLLTPGVSPSLASVLVSMHAV